MDWYIGNEWKLERKGLRKIVLALDFTALEKPTQVSKVCIKILEIKNTRERPTKFLQTEMLNKTQELEMGTGLTPLDCYLELLVQQMVLGEKAQCFIKTANNEEINFILLLERILENRQIHTLTVLEMYERAKNFKENGVKMFKNYSKFAHEYFVHAAKCLISYKPFDNLTIANDGVDGIEMQKLFINIQTNIAACLLNEKRYEDVIYQTEFVETVKEPSEKAIYRRALAFFNMKEYEKAQKTIERMPKYHEKKDFVKLQQRIVESWKTSNDHYASLCQRMFN